MGKMMKNALVLTVITLVSGTLLGAVYEITKEPIRASKESAKQEAYRAVMADAAEFETYGAFDADEAAEALEKAGIKGCEIRGAAAAKAADGSEIGYVITSASKEGYGGEIEISVGILNDGTVTGIEILAINETAGLGMNAKTPEFKSQFSGVKTEKFRVKKDNPGGNIDALSGATITSRAVTGAVNAGLGYFQNVLGGSVDE